LSLIFAVAKNGVIGNAGGLPWNHPEDREHFERLTHGHAVIMGRRTWEETGKPLEGRTNIVVSQTFTPPPGVNDVIAMRDVPTALDAAYAIDPNPFVIGGAKLFEATVALATRVYVTELPESPPGDTRFSFDRTDFVETARRTSPDGLVFLTYDRVLRRSPDPSDTSARP
jgi:dihydrofolate reductase